MGYIVINFMSRGKDKKYDFRFGVDGYRGYETSEIKENFEDHFSDEYYLTELDGEKIEPDQIISGYIYLLYQKDYNPINGTHCSSCAEKLDERLESGTTHRIFMFDQFENCDEVLLDLKMYKNGYKVDENQNVYFNCLRLDKFKKDGQYYVKLEKAKVYYNNNNDLVPPGYNYILKHIIFNFEYTKDKKKLEISPKYNLARFFEKRNDMEIIEELEMDNSVPTFPDSSKALNFICNTSFHNIYARAIYDFDNIKYIDDKTIEFGFSRPFDTFYGIILPKKLYDNLDLIDKVVFKTDWYTLNVLNRNEIKAQIQQFDDKKQIPYISFTEKPFHMIAYQAGYNYEIHFSQDIKQDIKIYIDSILVLGGYHFSSFRRYLACNTNLNRLVDTEYKRNNNYECVYNNVDYFFPDDDKWRQHRLVIVDRNEKPVLPPSGLNL